jgi:DNA-directed RNA polymerase specialized sigma24 family protein
MSVVDILAALAKDRRDRAAAAELQQLVNRLAKAVLAKNRHFDQSLLEDASSAVLIKLLEMIDTEQHTSVANSSYVYQMLHRWWVDTYRKVGERERPLDVASIPRMADEGHRPGPSECLTALKQELDLARQAATAARAARFRNNLERDIDQVFSLACSLTWIETLVCSQGVSAATLYKRHERARAALLEAIDTIDDDVADQHAKARMRQICTLLARCQSEARSGVCHAEQDC